MLKKQVTKNRQQIVLCILWNTRRKPKACPLLPSPVPISTREKKPLTAFQTSATRPCSGNCLIFFLLLLEKNKYIQAVVIILHLVQWKKVPVMVVRKLRDVLINYRLLPQMQPYYKDINKTSKEISNDCMTASLESSHVVEEDSLDPSLHHKCYTELEKCIPGDLLTYYFSQLLNWQIKIATDLDKNVKS